MSNHKDHDYDVLRIDGTSRVEVLMELRPRDCREPVWLHR
jgi:hypothetical protein